MSDQAVRYVGAYNRRGYLQWCYDHGYDYQRLDWGCVPSWNWLPAHGEPQCRYMVTPRAAERRDWPRIEAGVDRLGAVRVYAPHEDPDTGLTAFAYTPDDRMPQPSGLTRRFAEALDALPPTVVEAGGRDG